MAARVIMKASAATLMSRDHTVTTLKLCRVKSENTTKHFHLYNTVVPVVTFF